MLAFWGTNDDILQSFDTTADLGAALAERGVATMTLDGCDHVGAVVGLGEIVDELMDWLDEPHRPDRITSLMPPQ